MNQNRLKFTLVVGLKTVKLIQVYPGGLSLVPPLSELLGS